MGLHRAWPDAEIVGVDINPQPRYPFTLVQGDALTYPLEGFDFIWASPPCQSFTAYKRRPNHVAERPNYIPRMRELLRQRGVPWVMENVPGAPLQDPYTLCGSMFGLDVRRHRIFETSFSMLVPACNHGIWTRRFKPATNRKNLRFTIEIGSWDEKLQDQQKAMGIDWMELKELSEAIPPAYSEYIARQT